MSGTEAARARFGPRAAAYAALAAERDEALGRRLRRFVPLRGDERALDAGTGTGSFALVLAPLVGEVVGVDVVPEMLVEARRLAPANAIFVEGDVCALPFEAASFDLAATARTLHHVRRPELAVAELARVTREGGRLLVVDQIAAVDPLAAAAHNRIESLRDPSHVRALSDADLRALFDANDLVLERFEAEEEERELDAFLDLAGCEGPAREFVLEAVEDYVRRGERAGIELRRRGSGYAFTATIAWYLLRKGAT